MEAPAQGPQPGALTSSHGQSVVPGEQGPGPGVSGLGRSTRRGAGPRRRCGCRRRGRCGRRSRRGSVSSRSRIDLDDRREVGERPAGGAGPALEQRVAARTATPWPAVVQAARRRGVWPGRVQHARASWPPTASTCAVGERRGPARGRVDDVPEHRGRRGGARIGAPTASASGGRGVDVVVVAVGAHDGHHPAVRRRPSTIGSVVVGGVDDQAPRRRRRRARCCCRPRSPRRRWRTCRR